MEFDQLVHYDYYNSLTINKVDRKMCREGGKIVYSIDRTKS